jgi:hypothetical protein
MPLVQSPTLGYGQPISVEFVLDDVRGHDGPPQHGGVDGVEVDVTGRNQSPGRVCLFATVVGQFYVRPSGVRIIKVGGAFAVTN